VRLDERTTADVLPRLRRVHGQLGGVVRMLEEGRDCREVVTQLAAVDRALDRAGFRLLSGGLRQCLAAAAAGDAGAAGALTPDEMEKLFLSLA
jgi:DNA-binding FrmR family transcriptional regulator